MQKRSVVRIALAVVLVLSCHQTAWCQDSLTPEAIEPVFGDLSRPADVLLAEADAKVARAALSRRLMVYAELKAGVTERRLLNVDELDGVTIDNKEAAAELEQMERALKQTESEIRDLSKQLDTSWLIPVQTGIDDQQVAAALKNAKVLVTTASKAGDVLEPTCLTLTAPGVSPVGFVQISPRVYLASGFVAGEYQLAWQLTPKSVVQRVPKITIPEQGCVVCEVKLEMPEPTCSTKVVESIVLPHRSTAEQRLNISVTKPIAANGSATKPEPDKAPSATVATADVAISNSETTRRASTANLVEGPEITSKEALLDLPILWDEECLFSYELIGVKLHTHSGEGVVFFEKRQDTVKTPAPLVLTAVVELPYQQGQLHGKVRRWAEDGTLLVEVPYRNGLMDGESRFFNRKGKLLGTSTLVKGTGTYRIWDRNKNEPVLLREVDYLDGQEQRKP